MRPARVSLRLVLPVAVALAAGCGTSTPSSSGGTLRVVATTTHVAEFARIVGGDDARVTGLLPPNADTHDYEPTPKDAAAVAEADVVVTNGVGLDTWSERLIEGTGDRPTTVVASSDLRIRSGDDESPDGDPHVWFDPRNAARMVDAIATAFAAADPANAGDYRSRAAAYVGQIEQLDRELQDRIASVPTERRTIVTDHDAFGYFADRYGIEVVGTIIPSLSTGAEPNARDLARLADTIRAEGVTTIFTEASVEPRLATAIAAETGAAVGRPLYGDSLGEAGSPGATYLGMMRSNMDALIAGMTRR